MLQNRLKSRLAEIQLDLAHVVGSITRTMEVQIVSDFYTPILGQNNLFPVPYQP